MADEDDEERAAIRELYVLSQGRLLDRVTAVEVAVADVADGTPAGEVRDTGVHEAHKLAGSLGTFGLPTGSALAKELELLLEGDPDPEQVLHATELVTQLRAAVEAGPA